MPNMAGVIANMESTLENANGRIKNIKGDAVKRRVALISGASRGIGRAIAVELASQGWDIAFCYQSNESAADCTAKEIMGTGGRARYAQCDVSNIANVRTWVESIEDSFGEISLVVNCAGITRDSPLVMMSDNDWREVLDINLTGVFNLCRSAVFSMLKRKCGNVINLSSISGVYGNATQSNYSASKAGIIGFSKALSKEVGPYGIRVNVVAPGFIQTDMTAKLAPALKEKFIRNVPLRRFGDVHEVAKLVAFLGSDDAAYITGQVFGIDGGLVV